MNIFSIISLLGGLTFFLFGMNVMSGSLEKMAGGTLEHRLQKVASNPFVSLVLGITITIAMQSSSASTVMMVGLVNSGIMTFGQTLNFTFGANIGTTLTAWILSLSGIEGDNLFVQMLKPENFSPVLAFIGIILIMMSKSDKKKSIGTVFVGFAVLMYGMELMKDAVAPLGEMPQFKEILVQFNNPIIGVLIGTVFTALIQSSAASIGILQALSLTGGINYYMAIPIVMGQNIGTCITALISSIGTDVKARRVAMSHVFINLSGTLVLLPLYLIANSLFNLSFSQMAITPVSLAIIHTVFNVTTTVILMPLGKQLVKLIEKIVPDKQTETKIDKVPFIDERLLRTPAIAISECNSISKMMATLSVETVQYAVDNLYNYNKTVDDMIREGEDDVDIYEDRLSTYLVKLSSQALSAKDSQIVSKVLHAIGDFERISDHAVGIMKVAKEMHDKKLHFSAYAQKEIAVLSSAIKEIIEITHNAYKKSDVELATQVEPLEQVIDMLTAQIRANHIERLQRGECTVELGFVLSDYLNNCSRISDHCSNIAVAIIEVEHNSMEAHQYLSNIKYGSNGLFNERFESYSEKYTLS